MKLILLPVPDKLRYYFICIVFPQLFNFVNAQEKLAPDVYLIRFTDKDHNNYQLSRPFDFLSSRALERRQRQEISLVDSDLPVSAAYMDSIRKMGFTILNASKWLNAVSVQTNNLLFFQNLRNISFVRIPETSNRFLSGSYPGPRKYDISATPAFPDSSLYYGYSYQQIALNNGIFLHNQGLRGQGMMIAVIDAGFENADKMSCFDSLWQENRVFLTRDTYNPAGNVFTEDQHGSMVLSTMAADVPGSFVGTAPKAGYILLRSEDATSEANGMQREYLVEEFNWAVAAELADSIGADIISTSLGYSKFNDPYMNHTYRDMNGKTTMVSLAAGIAASKGIIVVVSAGNEGESFWKHITAPADADSILTVGAIDNMGDRATFSSVGPSFDRRIKPDVVAMGVDAAVQTPDNVFSTASGTSFSTPIIAGLTACLWQAYPEKTALQVIMAIRASSSHFNSPDSLTGFGVPDFERAFYSLVKPTALAHLTRNKLSCYPNPFSSGFYIEFPVYKEGNISISVFDCAGNKLLEKEAYVSPSISDRIFVKEFATFPNGMYIVRVLTQTGILSKQIIKLSP